MRELITKDLLLNIRLSATIMVCVKNVHVLIVCPNMDCINVLNAEHFV